MTQRSQPKEASVFAEPKVRRMTKKQEHKQYLDSMLSNSLQETLERKAQSYKKYGLEKQAKKVRAFKKQVREMVGSL